jgi:cellulose synthase/poly-beta-1,6-N-acetylglucosamine synthase-like glycosyltransferase
MMLKPAYLILLSLGISIMILISSGKLFPSVTVLMGNNNRYHKNITIHIDNILDIKKERDEMTLEFWIYIVAAVVFFTLANNNVGMPNNQ